MTSEALLALAERLVSRLECGRYVGSVHVTQAHYCPNCDNSLDDAREDAITLRDALATPPAGETRCANGDCRDHYGDPAAWCSRCRAGETPQGEAHDYEDARRTAGIPRYTIEQKEGTIYFRLTEDACGAWVSFANHDALVAKLEERIARAEAVRATPDRSEG